MGNYIGRERETQELLRLYNSKRPEFVAVYGRRRVGKTFLIKEFFKDKMAFYHTGLSPFESLEGNQLTEQLRNFYASLRQYGCEEETRPTSWFEAFQLLKKILEKRNKKERLVVFIDELPWMDTPRSNFLSAFEHFWNSWGANQSNLLLVVCGSSTSWVRKNLIENRGGLYNRLTYEIKLYPFSLYESELYFKSLGVKLSRYDITQAYMALGGIPYYMNFWNPSMSLAQNIDNLFFVKEAKLKTEFERLFGSLFTNAETYMAVVRFLSTKHCGFSRSEIAQKTKIPDGGGLTSILEALEASDFIVKYQPYENNKRNLLYKVVDNFCLFYLRFVSSKKITDTQYWQKNLLSHDIATWRGIAFEEVCLQHIGQIKKALGVSAVTSTEASWTLKGDESYSGAQIDLVITRSDNVVNLCEMKYYGDDYVVDKEEDRKMRHRITMINQTLSRKQTLFVVLITSFGLKQNAYSSIFQQTITLDDLFEKP